MERRHLSLEIGKDATSEVQDSGNSVINKRIEGVKWRLGDGSEVMWVRPAGNLVEENWKPKVSFSYECLDPL